MTLSFFTVCASPCLSFILPHVNCVSLASPLLPFSLFFKICYSCPIPPNFIAYYCCCISWWMAHFIPNPIICTPSFAENLKNVLAEIFEDGTVCALQAKLETQISSSFLGRASNVSYSTGEIYVPASVSQLGHKLSLIVLWLLTHRCCFLFYPTFLFKSSHALSCR